MEDQVKYRFCKDCPDYLACGRIYDRRKRRKHCGKATLSSHKIIVTNADRIRSMTDEELAEWIESLIIDRYIGVPVEEWLNWLQQEAE